MQSIYQDIAARTGGNIYIGVVGPVRTGKSTLIKRIMELAVIPKITDPYRAERAKDELPQSGSGKTIMTAEPKFVPEEAVQIQTDEKTSLSVRMIDSVGYMVDGAVGAEEDGHPRMVTTPWADVEIPMTEAAELGTRKVMEEHCTIGLVVTTDGTITDIPRADYVDAESRAVADMKATGKPFLVIVNSRNPAGEAAQNVCRGLHSRFGVHPLAMDCLASDEGAIMGILSSLLATFPMEELDVYLPRWMDALEEDHPVKQALFETLLQCASEIDCLGTASEVLPKLQTVPEVEDFTIRSVDMGSGIVSCSMVFPQALFYEILSAKAGVPIGNDGELLQMLTRLSETKKAYDKLSDALSSVRATGYGVVMPTAEEMKLEKPEIVRKGSTYGVKLRAGAPAIHMMRIDIDTEISPMVGDEKQSRELIEYLQGENPEKLWQSNIFGKSVYDLIQEGLTGKLLRTPEDVRTKFRGTMTRIVNEGANGLICILL